MKSEFKNHEKSKPFLRHTVLTGDR